MKSGFTAIALVVDRSGSMNSVREDTIGGINSFIKQHKDDNDGETRVTIAQFDDKYEVPYNFVDLKEIPEFTKNDFYPRGMTALLDAIGKTMDNFGKIFSEMQEEERPSKVIVAIITDGIENASCKYNRDAIQEMVHRQEEVYRWDVLFLGAGLDAVDIARSYGVAASKAMSYDTGKMDIAFNTMAASTLRGKKGLSMDFTAEERLANAHGTTTTTTTTTKSKKTSRKINNY